MYKYLQLAQVSTKLSTFYSFQKASEITESVSKYLVEEKLKFHRNQTILNHPP